MPGFDGTGPRGMGPMTGKGRGFCNPSYAGSRAPSTGAYSYGRSYGFGYGPSYPGYGYDPYAPILTVSMPLAQDMVGTEDLA